MISNVRSHWRVSVIDTITDIVHQLHLTRSFGIVSRIVTESPIQHPRESADLTLLLGLTQHRRLSG
jgi:hypothetical protein